MEMQSAKSSALAIGTKVKIQGLKRQEKFNDSFAHILACEEDGDHFLVQVEHAGKKLRVRSTNICTDTQTASAASCSSDVRNQPTEVADVTSLMSAAADVAQFVGRMAEEWERLQTQRNTLQQALMQPGGQGRQFRQALAQAGSSPSEDMHSVEVAMQNITNWGQHLAQHVSDEGQHLAQPISDDGVRSLVANDLISCPQLDMTSEADAGDDFDDESPKQVQEDGEDIGEFSYDSGVLENWLKEAGGSLAEFIPSPAVDARGVLTLPLQKKIQKANHLVLTAERSRMLAPMQEPESPLQRKIRKGSHQFYNDDWRQCEVDPVEDVFEKLLGEVLREDR